MKKLIVINGASCAGKSSVCQQIKSNNKRIFRISYDQMKRCISDYDAIRDFDDVYKILIKASEQIFSLGIDAYLDGAIFKKPREQIIALAKKNDYKIVELNLDPPYDVLRNRFQERVDQKDKFPNAPISNTSIKRFDQLFETYKAEKNPQAFFIDSSVLTPEQIYKKIEKLFE